MLFRLLAGALTLAYPLAVWWGLEHVAPRWLALALLALVLVRLAPLRFGRDASPTTATRLDPRWLLAGAALLGALAFVGNAVAPLKLYPVLVNAALLALFGASLVRGPSLIERLARLSEPELPPAGVHYTRRVTQLWCAFFVVNGSMAAITALYADTATWALYNGLVAYLLIGILFAGEWCVRQFVKARLAHG
ncbi:MAG: hypothetical protein RLZZ598_1976 [Pseudomonadota bacterium]